MYVSDLVLSASTNVKGVFVLLSSASFGVTLSILSNVGTTNNGMIYEKTLASVANSLTLLNVYATIMIYEILASVHNL